MCNSEIKTRREEAQQCARVEFNRRQETALQRHPIEKLGKTRHWV